MTSQHFYANKRINDLALAPCPSGLDMALVSECGIYAMLLAR